MVVIRCFRLFDARVGSWSRVGLLAAVAVVMAGSCLHPVAPESTSPPRAGRAARGAPAGAAARPALTLAHPRLLHLVLPSGMRLLLDEDPHATAAGAVSIVTGGSSADPVGAEGLAHLVEHLAYRAVDPAVPGAGAGEPSGNRRDRLTRLGAVASNAHTTHDCLIFYELGPTARLDALLTLATSRLVRPLVGVDEDAFVRERRIVGNEILLREDPRRGAWAIHALMPALFPPSHRYARPTAGTDGSRRKLTLAQARAYAAQNFVPNG